MGDDHAVEQRANGVEAANVQACRVVTNTDEHNENTGERKSLWNTQEVQSERRCAVESVDPEREPFPKQSGAAQRRALL